MQKLTDDAILDMIFDPQSEYVLPCTDPSSQSIPNQIPPLDETLLKELKDLELKAIEHSSKSDYPTSLEILNQVLLRCPTYSSGYNNRAQVYRLLGDEQSALRDLNKAIELSERDPSAHTVRGNAYTQRAILKRNMGDLKGEEQDLQVGAKYGNPIAKDHIKQNPYAKLCSYIVQEAMKKSRP